jgi:hypothetical protein
LAPRLTERVDFIQLDVYFPTDFVESRALDLAGIVAIGTGVQTYRDLSPVMDS